VRNWLLFLRTHGASANGTQHAPHVFPNTTQAARYVVRFHRAELIAAGALVRVGRELCILGGPYAKWLVRKARLVASYTVPMNAPEHAARRGGRSAT
jgi:hypothetical protein